MVNLNEVVNEVFEEIVVGLRQVLDDLRQRLSIKLLLNRCRNKKVVETKRLLKS